MKKRLVVFVPIICLIFVASAIAWNFKNEPDGFRGIKWGDDISTLKEMIYVKTDPSYGGVKLYSKKGDSLEIGNAKLKFVYYDFWQNKFCGVRISFKGTVNWINLKDIMFEKFGDGAKPNRFMESYLWDGDRSRISLEYKKIQDMGMLWIYSAEISKQQEEFSNQKAKEGAEKGF